MSPISPDWQMSCAAVAALLLICVVMKAVAARCWTRRGQSVGGFVCSPVLSPTSLARSRPLALAPQLLVKAVLLAGGLVGVYWVWWHRVLPAGMPAVVLGYGSVLPLLLLTDLIATVLALAYAPTGRLLPAFHCNPLAAESVNDFWARRWNLWFSDWFRLVLLRPLRRRPGLALLVIFFVSGVVHEVAVNVPLRLITGRPLLGSMMIYYLLQAAGIWMERYVPKEQVMVRRLFAWVVVLGPVPLMMNEGMLRIMHLWPR